MLLDVPGRRSYVSVGQTSCVLQRSCNFLSVKRASSESQTKQQELSEAMTNCPFNGVLYR